MPSFGVRSPWVNESEIDRIDLIRLIRKLMNLFNELITDLAFFEPSPLFGDESYCFILLCDFKYV